MSESIKILIIEDDAVIAQLIDHYLIQFGYHVIDIIHNGDKALDAIHIHQPDLVLLDINIEGTKDGIDIANIIESKYDIPYLFITALSDSLTIDRIKDLDPLAYIIKPFKEEDLRVSIALGMNTYQRKKSNNNITLEEVNQQCLTPLSEKEFNILIQIGKGLSNKQIGEFLDLSTNTVKWHTQNIFSKMGVKNRTSAAQFLMDY